MSRDWLLYLDDIIACGEKIGKVVQHHDFESFMDDDILFDAVLMNLLMMGEASKQLPDEVVASEPNAGWAGVARMRDVIAHHYFSLDAHIVWDAATFHVPSLLVAAKRILVNEEERRQG